MMGHPFKFSLKFPYGELLVTASSKRLIANKIGCRKGKIKNYFSKIFFQM